MSGFDFNSKFKAEEKVSLEPVKPKNDGAEIIVPAKELEENIQILEEEQVPVTTIDQAIKKTKRKTTKPKRNYKAETYNIQLSLPMEMKDNIKICGNYYGTIKDYFMHLMEEDWKENMRKYQEKAQKSDSNWYSKY